MQRLVILSDFRRNVRYNFFHDGFYFYSRKTTEASLRAHFYSGMRQNGLFAERGI